MAKLDFWFDFASTYSYLTAMRIEDLARERGVRVRWRPFLLGPVFKSQGWDTSPFNIYPAKGRYMWRDMERLAQARGLALQRFDPFPQNSLHAARWALAAAAVDPDAAVTFACAVFRAEFAEGRDISAVETLADCASASGLHADVVQEAAQSDTIKLKLRQETEEAQRLEIFGAPTFTTPLGESFWGDDRLEQALDWATRELDEAPAR
ncbi:2-hydroxychromene-2-carboxylate isomerase [Tepidamorphus sp. 3E244]|uniref:2-hydroxychromene-2-carboxylate isomerase n=1 Tax=Tepidamorphus sp. 3E244 TaxID=3385498 RepID=UPI0038FCEF22